MGGEDAAERDERGRDEAVDLARLIAAIRRRRRWILVCVCAAALASGAFVLLASPRYTGVAKVLLEDQESYYTRPDKASGTDPAATIDPEAVQSQAEAVASSDLARKAIDRLDLAANPEFNASDGRVGEIDQRVVDKFLSRLTVFPVPKSRVLQIEFVSRDPKLAARGANTIAEVFLESQAEAKANAARAAGAWLSRKIDELRAKVAEADDKVEAFRAESGLLAGANGQTVSAQQLSDLNAQLANARSAQAAATAKAALLRKLQKEGRLDDAPGSVTDESMRRIAERRVALKAQIAEAARTLLPLHPRMKELAADLASLDGQIRDAAVKNVRALENDARLAGDQVASLSATLAQQSKTVAAGNADDVQLRALEMEAKASRDQLESYLQKYREAAAREADNPSPADARVIATAEPPRAPTFPKPWQTILLATLAALVVSAGVAAASALVSDGTPARASRATGQAPSAPALAAEDDPALPEPRSVGDFGPGASHDIGAFDSTEALADRLARSKPNEGSLVVLIAGHKCGQALAIALETARRLSAGAGTLLVDLGVTQDWFADIVDREDGVAAEIVGLKNLLAGDVSFGDVIRRDLSSNLDVICAGGDLSGLERLDEVLSVLASAYGRVVLHASEWRAAPARAAADRADVVVIAAAAIELAQAVQSASETLGLDRAEILAFCADQLRPAFDEAA